jgi:hypothetical protein
MVSSDEDSAIIQVTCIRCRFWFLTFRLQLDGLEFMGQPLKVNRLQVLHLLTPSSFSPTAILSCPIPQVSRPHDFIPYEAIMAEKNNHTQTEAVASFLQTASAIVKPPSSSSSLGNFNLAPQRKMPAADVVIHFQKRARIIEVSGLQAHPAMSPELLQVSDFMVIKSAVLDARAGVF